MDFRLNECIPPCGCIGAVILLLGLGLLGLFV